MGVLVGANFKKYTKKVYCHLSFTHFGLHNLKHTYNHYTFNYICEYSTVNLKTRSKT